MIRMRQLIFVNRYFYPDHSATSQMLTDLAFNLAENGKAVRVITSRQVYDHARADLPANETINGVQVMRVWTTRFGRSSLMGRAIDYLTFYSSAAWRLLVSTSRGDTVIAKTDPPMISILSAIIARLRGARLINWIQDLFPEVAVALGVKSIGAISPLLMKVRNYSLRAAHTNVVLGDRMAGRVLSYGIPEQRIQVIHNWSDGKDIMPLGHDHNRLRHEWGLDGIFVIGYSGNMGRAHDFQTLVETASILKHENNIAFLFIGSGAQQGWITKQMQAREIRNVHFKPYQPRNLLTLSLSMPDIHIVSLLPSLEGLIVPSKFYGIAAAGRPVLNIGDKDGEIARILNKCSCGHTVEPGDALGAAEYIRMLVSNRTFTDTLGANARRTFDKFFDKEIAIKKWKELLEM